MVMDAAIFGVGGTLPTRLEDQPLRLTTWYPGPNRNKWSFVLTVLRC